MSDLLRCPYCSTANRPHMTWCIECGEPLDGSAPPAPAHLTAARTVLHRPPRAAIRNQEVLLGVALLLVILVVALGGWWVEERGAASYGQGVTAVADHRWVAAAEAFAAAGAYRDAPTRAAEAAATIQQIAQSYEQGRAAWAAQDWDSAERAFAHVVTLQPDYRDGLTRLAQVRALLAGSRAAGVIYATSGDDGGLYLTTPAGPPYPRLPHSSRDSRVLLFAPDGHYALYSDDALRNSMAQGWDMHTGLWLADLSSPGGPQAWPVPASFSPAGTGMAGGAGFWWTSPAPDGGRPTLAYYAYATHTATTLPAESGTAIVANDPRWDWPLLAATYEAADGPHTRLLLCTAVGVPYEVATVVDGLVEAAQISDDGQYVLFTAVQRTSTQINRQLVLLRLALPIPNFQQPGPQRSIVLDSLTVPVDHPLSGGRLTARIVPGSRPTLVLEDRSDAQGRSQTIYNVDTEVQARYLGQLPPPAVQETFSLSRSGRWVLTQHPDSRGALLVVQDSHSLTTRHDLVVPAAPDTWVIGQLARRDDYLLYTTTMPPPGAAKQGFKLWSAPLDAAGVPGTPRLLYGAYYDPRHISAPAPTLPPSGRALLYLTSDGVLTATTLDGASTTPVAEGVRRVWAP